MLRARLRRRPRPHGSGTVDHDPLAGVLTALAAGGVGAIDLAAIDRYLGVLAAIDPDEFAPDEALAYWLNLYNAGALHAARRAWDADAGTILRMPGAFTRPFVTVAGERLSLDGVEHGKIRRFGDPRIHAALVCGSVSCPTLRHEPFRGADLSAQLDDQMRHFLAAGAIQRIAGVIRLSRVFRWYGGDLVHPHRMPTLLPVSRRRVLAALRPWLTPEVLAGIDREDPRIEFQGYDWSLGCAVTPPA